MKPMQVSIRVNGVPAAAAQLRQLAAAHRQLQQIQQGSGGGFAGGGGFPAPRGGGGGRARSTFMSRLSGLVGSTRLNLGVASPLVGRIGGLVGGAAGGPMTLGLAAAAVTLGAFTSAVKRATDAATAYASAGSISGAGPGQLSRLGALGLNPTDAANAANALRERLASDPMAQMARTQMGLGYVAPGSHGPVDNAKILADSLEALRSITNAEEQLRLARKMGLEGYLEELRVSESVYRARKRDAEAREKLMDPQFIQATRDFNGELKIMGDLFGDAMVTFSKEVLPDVVVIMQQWSGIIRDSMPMVKQLGEAVHQMWDSMVMSAVKVHAILNGMNPDSAWAGYQAAQDILNSDLVQQAMNSNTKAVNANTKALWAQTPGTFGGGGRARGALPSQFAAMLSGSAAGSPSEFNRLINGKTLALGPWSL